MEAIFVWFFPLAEKLNSVRVKSLTRYSINVPIQPQRGKRMTGVPTVPSSCWSEFRLEQASLHLRHIYMRGVAYELVAKTLTTLFYRNAR